MQAGLAWRSSMKPGAGMVAGRGGIALTKNGLRPQASIALGELR
jgi:hypothetical protein